MTFAVPFLGQLRVIASSLASAHMGIDPHVIMQRSRKRKAALARHIAIYLAHVACGMRITDVARAFERDPATIRYACARIEDARDDLYFDQRLTALELQARSAAEGLSAPSHQLGENYDER